VPWFSLRNQPLLNLVLLTLFSLFHARSDLPLESRSCILVFRTFHP
jgi:hypothetical protein